MDENKSPQDFFNEIFEKSQAAAPPMPQPRFELPGDDPPPGGPTETRGAEAGTKLFPWLCVVLGAALLAMALCLFLMMGMNGRLDALEEAVAGLDSVDQKLAEENNWLKEENAALQKDVGLHQYSTTQSREQYENERQANAECQEQLNQTRFQLTYAIILGYLERFINKGDYLMAACVVEQCDQHFNENNWIQLETDALPTQVTRYMELRDWLEDHGHVLVLRYNNEDGNDPSEQPVVALGYATNVNDETKAICVTARNLWGIIWSYSESHAADNFYNTAISTAKFCHPEKGTSEQLYSKAFQPSTIALFEQIRADLMDQGLLVEQDGLLYFADDSGPVDFDLLVGELELTGAGSNNEDNAFPN